MSLNPTILTCKKFCQLGIDCFIDLLKDNNYDQSDWKEGGEATITESCFHDGITLIVIPYWWEKKIESVARCIHSNRPDILVERRQHFHDTKSGAYSTRYSRTMINLLVPYYPRHALTMSDYNESKEWNYWCCSVLTILQCPSVLRQVDWSFGSALILGILVMEVRGMGIGSTDQRKLAERSVSMVFQEET